MYNYLETTSKKKSDTELGKLLYVRLQRTGFLASRHINIKVGRVLEGILCNVMASVFLVYIMPFAILRFLRPINVNFPNHKLYRPKRRVITTVLSGGQHGAFEIGALLTAFQKEYDHILIFVALAHMITSFTDTKHKIKILLIH